MRLGLEAATASTTGVGNAAASGTGQADPEETDGGAAASSQHGSTPGSRTMGTGAIVMGFGLGSVVVGLIFAGLASATSASGLLIPALIFGATIGPILLVVGLVIVIVGLSMRAME
jgi:hypothetical protein